MENISHQLDQIIIMALRTGAPLENLIAQLEHHAERLRMAKPLVNAAIDGREGNSPC